MPFFCKPILTMTLNKYYENNRLGLPCKRCAMSILRPSCTRPLAKGSRKRMDFDLPKAGETRVCSYYLATHSGRG